MASDLTSDTFLASKKISDEIKADLAVHPEKYTMLTGDRPTGRLHMGHYFGTIRERVALQNAGVTTRIIIADYQVITDRDPTVKAEQEASGHALTGLLLSYPVHQACDILFCKGNVVPVGKDQLPHIEQTRQIARRFNERYGQVFPEPHGLLTDAVEIPGLDGRKMSKSYGNAIALSATEEETAKLIKKSKTDSERMITFDKENRPGVSALLTTAALTTGRTEQDIAAEIGNDGAGALKRYVTESVNAYLAPIRERRRELEGQPEMVREILHEGNRRANEIANTTLDEVREAMGMVY